MAARNLRAQDRDTLAQFLGWFSIALGSAQVSAPRAMCKLVGADGEGSAPLVMRLMGLRELTQGVAILARPRPTTWMWSRVAGDGLDLSALGVIAARNRRVRTAFAIANVLAVAAPDVFEALHLSREHGEPAGAKRVRKAITVNRPRDEVAEAFERDLRAKVGDAEVRFDDAPGGRWVEIHVEWDEDPPLGELGAVAKKLTGKDLATRLADELRLLKQRLETGDIVRSDSTPEGHELARHLHQRAAQPLETKEAVS